MTMRIVGNHHWQEFAATPQEALERGARLDVMVRLPYALQERTRPD